MAVMLSPYTFALLSHRVLFFFVVLTIFLQFQSYPRFISEIKVHNAMYITSKEDTLLSVIFVISFNLETKHKQTKYSLSMTLKYFSTISCHISCLFTLQKKLLKSTDYSTFLMCFFFFL